MPVTTPRVKETTFASTPGWTPRGRYVDIFTGRVYDGDRIIIFHRPLDEVPVLAKERSIIPLEGDQAPEDGCPIPEKMEVLLVVGADGVFDHAQAQGKLVIAANTSPLIKTRDGNIRWAWAFIRCQ